LNRPQAPSRRSRPQFFVEMIALPSWRSTVPLRVVSSRVVPLGRTARPPVGSCKEKQRIRRLEVVGSSLESAVESVASSCAGLHLPERLLAVRRRVPREASLPRPGDASSASSNAFSSNRAVDFAQPARPTACHVGNGGNGRPRAFRATAPRCELRRVTTAKATMYHGLRSSTGFNRPEIHLSTMLCGRLSPVQVERARQRRATAALVRRLTRSGRKPCFAALVMRGRDHYG
jgi:hypothetical protein